MHPIGGVDTMDVTKNIIIGGVNTVEAIIGLDAIDAIAELLDLEIEKYESSDGHL